MCVEYFDNITLAGTILDGRRSNALTGVPVAAEKRRGAAVERVAPHVAVDNGPSGEDGEAGADDAAKVKLGVGEEVAGGIADGLVVGLDPALLEADDGRGRVGGGDLAANLGEAGLSLGGEGEEAPAVEGEEVDFVGGRGRHGGGGDGMSLELPWEVS